MRILAVATIVFLFCVQARAQTTIEQQMAESRIKQQQLDAQTDSLRLQNQIMQLQMQIDRDRPREKSVFEIMGETRAKQAADEAAARAESDVAIYVTQQVSTGSNLTESMLRSR